MRMLFAFMLISLVHAPAMAASEVGRATVNGRQAILYDDGRWSYAARTKDTPMSCADRDRFRSKVVPVQVCLPRTKWIWSPQVWNPEFEANFVSVDRKLYAVVIPETVPLGEDTLRDAILARIRQSGEVRDLSDETIPAGDGQSRFRALIFSQTAKGVKFRYLIAYRKIGEKGVVQIVFYTPEGLFGQAVEKVRSVLHTATFAD